MPSPGKMGPTVIDKSQPIELVGSRLRDHTRTFDSGVRRYYVELPYIKSRADLCAEFRRESSVERESSVLSSMESLV